MSDQPQLGLYDNPPPYNTPMLHQSIATVLINKSPLHAYHRKFVEREGPETDATNLGDLCHALMLGGKEIVAVEANDWRTNAAKEQREAIKADRKIAVLAHKLREAEGIAATLTAGLEKRGIILNGVSEQTAIWQSPTGVWCAGRLDHLWLNKKTAQILDFKFVADASKRKCESSMIQYGYDIQHAAYVQAIGTIHPELAGRVTMRFVFIETEPPYAMRLMPLAGSMRTSGEYRWGKAVDLWRNLLDEYGTEHPWPAYYDDGEPAECPAWALNAELARNLVEEGGNL